MSSNAVRVLLIDDDEDDFVLVRDVLSEVSHMQYDVYWINDPEKVIQQIQSEPIDIILLDYHLGNVADDGLKMLNRLREQEITVPVVILTGKGDHLVDLQAMDIGASDYLLKNDYTPELLERSLRYALERHQNQQRLIHTNNQLQDFLDNASDIIHSVDSEGRFLFVNRAWKNALKYSDDDLKDLRIDQIIPPDVREKHMKFERELFTDPQRDNRFVETTFVSKDGQMIEVEGHLNVRYQNGQGVAIRAIYRNVTELHEMRLRELELQVENAKMEKFSQMMTNLSHDLRTPIAAIKLNLHLLEKFHMPDPANQRLKLLEKQVEYIQELGNSITYLDQHIDQKSPLEPVELCHVVDNVITRNSDLIRDAGLSVRRDFDDSTPQVAVDVLQIERALSNILENAIDASSHGDVIEVSVSSDNQAVIISIKDTGIGIEQQHLPYIFDHFYRVDQARTDIAHSGLGLTIAKQIVEAHHGSITLTSEVGQGTCVQLRFPINH